jgi:hypothetical protein
MVGVRGAAEDCALGERASDLPVAQSTGGKAGAIQPGREGGPGTEVCPFVIDYFDAVQ